MRDITEYHPAPDESRFEKGADPAENALYIDAAVQPFNHKAKEKLKYQYTDRNDRVHDCCATITRCRQPGMAPYELAFYAGEPGEDDHALICRFRKRKHIDRSTLEALAEAAVQRRKVREAS